MLTWHLFQFHKGTIRTVDQQQEQGYCNDFNSIKVQLELTSPVSWEHEYQISIP